MVLCRNKNSTVLSISAQIFIITQGNFVGPWSAAVWAGHCSAAGEETVFVARPGAATFSIYVYYPFKPIFAHPARLQWLLLVV